MVVIKYIRHPGTPRKKSTKNVQGLYGDLYEILKYIKEDLNRTIHMLEKKTQCNKDVNSL